MSPVSLFLLLKFRVITQKSVCIFNNFIPFFFCLWNMKRKICPLRCIKWTLYIYLWNYLPVLRKKTEEVITILFAVWTAVIRTDWLQDLAHGAVKTQAGYKQREFFIHENVNHRSFYKYPADFIEAMKWTFLWIKYFIQWMKIQL
jgi:hypothetical protein